MRIGVVGAGLVAQVAHLPLLREQDDHFALAGLAEPDPATRARVAARFGIARTAATQRELLERAELDAVLIASPNGAHAEQVLEALAAGLHVLVEKPLCLTPEDAARIVAAGERSGRVVQVGYMKRHDPAVEALLADLGTAEVVHVESLTHDPGLRAAFSPDRHGATPPRAAAAAGAPGRVAWWSDVFAGALVHDVNLLHGVVDRTGTPPVRVADAFAGDDRAGGTVELANGARWTAAWLALPAAGDFAERLTVYCADGIRRIEFPAPYLLGAPTVYTRTSARGGGARELRARTSWDEAYDRQLRHFRACIAAEERCRTPPEQAERDLALLAELFLTATAGEPAPVPA